MYYIKKDTIMILKKYLKNRGDKIMLTEKEIFGCSTDSKKVYWECSNCKYEKEKIVRLLLKVKLKQLENIY